MHIDLQFSADPELMEFVEGDADRLQQVIGNLLTNAVKFTPDGMLPSRSTRLN